MSSPATYPRCSAKSIDAPKYGARCRPLMKPSTTVRASNSRLPMRARTDGSTKRAPGTDRPELNAMSDAASHSGSRCRHDRQQLVDDRVGRDPLGLGAE